MFGKNIKLTAADGSVITDEAFYTDYLEAEKDGPFRVGKIGFYYRDGLKRFCIPIADIDNVFTRVQEVDTHVCCGGMTMYIYRLVVCCGGVEKADVRTEDEALVERVENLIAARSPKVRIGYTKPA